MKLPVGRCAIHLVDQGMGPPILFLHGIPDSADIWSGVIAHLRGQHRCIAPDLPGFGRSTAPSDFDYSLDGMADFVDRLLTTIGIRTQVHLVVHDIGGPFGLAWAVRHPHKVRSFVVMNTVFQSDYRWHRFARLYRTPVVGELVQKLTDRKGFTRELLRASRHLSREHIDDTYRLLTPDVRRQMLRWYRASDPQNFQGWEDALQVLMSAKPSLVLWGEHDPYIPTRYAHRFGACTVELVDDAGHWLPAEMPDLVGLRLQRFYAGLTTAAAPVSRPAAVDAANGLSAADLEGIMGRNAAASIPGG